jgi:hypothetical protein
MTILNVVKIISVWKNRKTKKNGFWRLDAPKYGKYDLTWCADLVYLLKKLDKDPYIVVSEDVYGGILFSGINKVKRWSYNINKSGCPSAFDVTSF